MLHTCKVARQKDMRLIKHGDWRCKMAGTGIQCFAKFRAQMCQADLGNQQSELCGLPQGKCSYCGLLKPEVKI
jgi:hypothetical protein